MQFQYLETQTPSPFLQNGTSKYLSLLHLSLIKFHLANSILQTLHKGMILNLRGKLSGDHQLHSLFQSRLGFPNLKKKLNFVEIYTQAMILFSKGSTMLSMISICYLYVI